MRVTCRWCRINNCKRFQCQKFGKLNIMADIDTEELPRTFRIPETIEIDEENVATTSNFSKPNLTPKKVSNISEISIYHKTPLRRPKIYKNYMNKETIFVRNFREARSPCWLKRSSLSSIRKTTNRVRNICVTLRKNYIENIIEFVRNENKMYNNDYPLYDIEEEYEEDVEKSERNTQYSNTFSSQVLNSTSPKIVELDEHGNEVVDSSVTSSINAFNNLSLENGVEKTWQNYRCIDLSEKSDNYNNLLDFRENMLICGLQSLHIPDRNNGSNVNERDFFESSIDTITQKLVKTLDMSQHQ
uniref:Uncharacterized protein n=1 Tax=Strongyloides venezuelensis TaxID=75913 RepID=A0A0K0FM08_STRVS